METAGLFDGGFIDQHFDENQHIPFEEPVYTAVVDDIVQEGQDM